MHKIPALVLAIITSVSLSTSAVAQDSKAVVAALAELNAADQSLSATYANLNTMSETVRDSEQAGIERVLDSIERTRASVTQLLMISNIYTLMVDQRDTNTVRRFLSLACKVVDTTTVSASESANRTLARLVSPALVQEVTKARDLIGQIANSKLCRIVPVWKS